MTHTDPLNHPYHNTYPAVGDTGKLEQLQVTNTTVPSSIAQLRKVIVTEQKTFTVEVRHEEVRLSTEPLSDDHQLADRGLSEIDEIELVLYEERVTINTEIVPVERVRLVRDIITVQTEITEDLRKERIELTTETKTP